MPDNPSNPTEPQKVDSRLPKKPDNSQANASPSPARSDFKKAVDEARDSVGRQMRDVVRQAERPGRDAAKQAVKGLEDTPLEPNPPTQSEMDVPSPDKWLPQTLVGNPDSWAHLVPSWQLQKAEEAFEQKQRNESNAARSADMARFFLLGSRLRKTASDIGWYFLEPGPLALLIGFTLAIGGFALGVSFAPDKFSSGFYTIAEVFFLISIILFFLSVARHFHSHTDRKLAFMLLAIMATMPMCVVIALFEWGRPRVMGNATSLPGETPSPVPVQSDTVSTKRISYSIKGSSVDLKGGRVIAFHERSAYTYDGLVQDWRIIEITMPPGPYIITVFHDNYGEFQGKVILPLTGERFEPFNVDAMMELTPQNK